MRLYHYTARHHVDGGSGHAGPGILAVGLQPTIHPYMDLRSGMVWLTDSDEWSQTWSTRDVSVVGYGPCNRTEVRLSVTIPRQARTRLLRWSEAGRFVITDGLRRDLERFGDPEHWWVYLGVIPPEWVTGVESCAVVPS